MDEQLSTWMDLVWSSRCLELLCTSTQSSNLKWVSGGGINGLWKSKRRMSRCYPFQGVGSSGAPSMSLSHWGSLTELLRCSAPTHCRFIRCWRPRSQIIPVSFHATVGWTATDPSVHPVLKASSWCVSVLFKHDHQIDRRFPPMDSRFIRRRCLRGSYCPIHPTQLEKGLSVHPTVSS
jgi:hypothetical protein